MGFGDKAKEVLHHVIDEVKEDKKLDQKLVLQETREQLLLLQEDVSYASVVLTELKKTNWVDAQKFQILDAQLRTKETQKGAVTEIARIIDEINNKYDTLRGDEKTKVVAMTAEIAKSKSSLLGLKSEVLNAAGVDYADVEKKLDMKIDEKFDGHWYSFLKDGYKKHVHEKVAELKGGKKNIDENIWEKVKSSLTEWFFGLVGTMVVGKNIADFMGEELGQYKDKLQDAVASGKDMVEKGKDAVVNFSPEQLKDKEKKVRGYVVALANKYGKKIDNATLDRVMKRIDMKKLASDNTAEVQKLFSQNWEDANVAQSLLEGVSLPFYAGFELIQALQDEGVIDYGDIAYNVTGETLEYGLKGFKLFGTGMRVACGSMSLKDVKGEMARLYDKSPDAARTLIWAIMYRTQHSPIFKFAANTGTLMAKATLWPLLEAKSDISALGHITDGLHGNMTTAVDELEDFVKYLPDGDTKFMKDIIKDFRGQVVAFKEINQINIIQRELTIHGNYNGNIALADIEKEYTKRSGIKSPFLEGLKDTKTGAFPAMTEGSFSSALKSRTKLIGDNVALNLKDADLFQKGGNALSKAKSALRFKPNEMTVMEDAMRYLESSTKRYANMMNNRGRTAPLKDSFQGLKGGLLNMQESLNEGKTYFNFKTAEDFEGFMKKAKYLGKQSPETLKFMLGKMPIFLVGGMALSTEGSMSDKMKALSHDLWTLLPIIGPSVIIWDAAKAGKLASGDPATWGQMGLGATLITADVYKIIRYTATHEWSKLGRYMLQPVTDIVELTKFAANATKNSIILTKDFINIAKTRTAAELGKSAWNFMKTESRLGRLSLVAGLVVGGYFTYDYFLGSNELDDDTKKQLAKYKDNPEQLDKDIEIQWPKLSQEEKNDYLRAGILRQGGFSPDKISTLDVKYDSKSKLYKMVLPSVISYDQVRALKLSLDEALGRVEPGAKMGVEFLGEARYYFTKELAQQFADIPAGEKKAKMEEYARAMGYEDPKTVLDEKSIS